MIQCHWKCFLCLSSLPAFPPWMLGLVKVGLASFDETTNSILWRALMRGQVIESIDTNLMATVVLHFLHCFSSLYGILQWSRHRKRPLASSGETINSASYLPCSLCSQYPRSLVMRQFCWDYAKIEADALILVIYHVLFVYKICFKLTWMI